MAATIQVRCDLTGTVLILTLCHTDCNRPGVTFRHYYIMLFFFFTHIKIINASESIAMHHVPRCLTMREGCRSPGRGVKAVSCYRVPPNSRQVARTNSPKSPQKVMLFLYILGCPVSNRHATHPKSTNPRTSLASAEFAKR